MTETTPQDLPKLLGLAGPRCREPQASVLVNWLQYLREKRGEDFLRQNGPSLLRAWEDFLRECWP
jgi:hypothetical protein